MSFIYLPPPDGQGSGGLDFTGITDGSAIPAGEIGAVVQNTVAKQDITQVTTVWGDGAITINLPAGVWFIEATVVLDPNGANISNDVQAGFSLSNNGTPDLYERIALPFQLVNRQIIMPIPSKLLNINSATDLYVNSRWEFDSGTPQHGGKIVARRYR